MILSRNNDVKGLVVKAIEGKPMYGGDLLVKPLIKGNEMTLLEIHYTPGVGAPLHVHDHESLAYVVKGKVKMTVGKEEPLASTACVLIMLFLSSARRG